MSLFDRLSPTAKRICIAVTLPILLLSIYLFFSGSALMHWVSEWRQVTIGESTGIRRGYAFELLIIFIVIGLPSMLPALVYDFIQKKRRSPLSTATASSAAPGVKQNILQFVLLPKAPKLKTRQIRKSLRKKYGKEIWLDAAKGGDSGVIHWNDFFFTYMCIDTAMPKSEFFSVTDRCDGEQESAQLVNQHQAHALITPLYIPDHPGAEITAAIFVMSVCEIIFGQSNPLAYYWSSSKRLFDAQAYQSALQSTEMALREKNQNSNEASSELPLDYWLSFNNFSYDKGRSWGIISQGVGAFFQFEIHFEPLAWDKRAIFDRFIGTAVYLFGRGVVLKEGDTLGASETEQFRVSYSKGSLKTLPRLTLKLEKIDQTLLSGEVA